MIKCWRAVEARGLCQAGLILDPDNKDLKDLKKVPLPPLRRRTPPRSPYRAGESTSLPCLARFKARVRAESLGRSMPGAWGAPRCQQEEGGALRSPAWGAAGERTSCRRVAPHQSSRSPRALPGAHPSHSRPLALAPSP